MAQKKVVVLAVEDNPKPPFTVTPSNLPLLRPLLRHMKTTLDSLAAGHYTYDMDYVGARIGPDTGVPVPHPHTGHLQKALRKHLKTLSQHPPDLIIVTVASAASKAAKHVVDADYPANRIPIVFTVVSEPDNEGLVGPGGVHPRLTGVSRDLVRLAPDAFNKFASCLTTPCDIYYFYRFGINQGDHANDNIQHHHLAGANPNPHNIPADPTTGDTDCSCISPLISTIPPYSPTRRTGLFMIPDDLVGACAADIIRAADTRGIPTFCQQPELVCDKDWNPKGPYAMGGHGVTPNWVGQKAADYAHKVLLVPDAATSLPFVIPTPSDLNLWFNTTVAAKFSIPAPSGATTCTSATPPPPTGARREARPAARGTQKSSKKKGAPKAKMARKARARKGQAARKKIGARGGGAAGRRTKKK